MKSNLVVEFSGKKFSQEEIVKLIKDTLANDGVKESQIKSLDIYVNTNASTVYYVLNGDVDNTREYVL